MQNNPNTLLSEQHCFYPPACSSLLHYHYYLHSWASIYLADRQQYLTTLPDAVSGSYHLIVGRVARASRRLRFPLAHLLRVGEEIELHVGVGVSPILQGLLHTHTHPHTQASVSVPQRKKNKQLEAPNTRTGLRPTDQYKNII